MPCSSDNPCINLTGQLIFIDDFPPVRSNFHISYIDIDISSYIYTDTHIKTYTYILPCSSFNPCINLTGQPIFIDDFPPVRSKFLRPSSIKFLEIGYLSRPHVISHTPIYVYIGSGYTYIYICISQL
jgi:hypothetical protein